MNPKMIIIQRVGVVALIIFYLALPGLIWAGDKHGPPESNPGQPFAEIIDKLNQLETTIDDLFLQPEPLSQVISRGYENRDDDDTTHEISSTGPMIVHVCGELIGAEEGSLVRFSITKGDVTVKKQISTENDRDTDCLLVGAEPDEVLTVFLGVGGSTELNTIITVQSTPSAVISINDIP